MKSNIDHKLLATMGHTLAMAVTDGYKYEPMSDGDLDNEQPITVSMTLGDYRRAQRIVQEATK